MGTYSGSLRLYCSAMYYERFKLYLSTFASKINPYSTLLNESSRFPKQIKGFRR